MIRTGKEPSTPRIKVSEEVLSYVQTRGCDFRVCTSCGGPILLPISVKPQKATDVVVKAGCHWIYISMYQAPYLDTLDIGLVPAYDLE
ncbi:MAG: hypothetical protein PHP59_09315 [Methanofollis sp.]|nr:hypothetical protein [Methanofollis sp.]MDD4255559.1 hypothetical protein [Methanofollis sp.]